MRYRVRHTTTYAYTYPVSVCHNALRLTPRECHHQRCSFHELLIYPEPMFVRQILDYFGNVVMFSALEEPHDALTMTANSTVEVTAADAPDPATTPPWERVREVLRRAPKGPVLEAYQHVFDSPQVSVDVTPLRS